MDVLTGPPLETGEHRAAEPAKRMILSPAEDQLRKTESKDLEKVSAKDGWYRLINQLDRCPVNIQVGRMPWAYCTS